MHKRQGVHVAQGAIPFSSERTRNPSSQFDFYSRGYAWLYTLWHRACITVSWAFLDSEGERGLFSVGVDVSARCSAFVFDACCVCASLMEGSLLSSDWVF
mmetsp:Transcript_27247/g.71775  ORF Transcript_27247/g.71775 Transcript_27247/m.71775 type:complete len:100 (-) Transcript_27247:119-418(-)